MLISVYQSDCFLCFDVSICCVVADLLNNTAEFVDKVLDEDDELCLSWTSQEFVVALLEAVKQIGFVA